MPSRFIRLTIPAMLVIVSLISSSALAQSVSIYQCFENQTQQNTITYDTSAGFFHYDMGFMSGSWVMSISAPFGYKANVYRRNDARDAWAFVEETRAVGSGGQWRWTSKPIHLGTGNENVLLQVTPAHPYLNKGTVLSVNLKSWKCDVSPPPPMSLPCARNQCGYAGATFGGTTCRKSPGCNGGYCGTPGCR